MPRLTEKERVQSDLKRLASNTQNVYRKWEDEYSCDMLEEYYYGKQYQGESNSWDQRKYVINLFYPSINISKPSLLFQIPKYKVTARPTRIDDPLSDVEARAKLQEETLNSCVQDPKLGYAVEVGLALLDSQFRFGILQVGYTADFIDNPNADKPLLTDRYDEAGNRLPMLDSDDKPVMDAKFSMKSEGLFLKWIPAKQFRVIGSSNRLSANDAVSYFEWHYLDDIKNNKRYKNTKDLRATGRLKEENAKADPDAEQQAGMVKVWFYWDIRKKERRVFAEGGEKYFLQEPFKFLPFADLKFDEILRQWLPLPPTYNWAHPQNQLNDGREMRRVHRKRAIRRYLRRSGAFSTEEEWAKLCEGDDMQSAEVNGDPATAALPLPDAPLDPALFRDMEDHLADFTRESGISGESQQVAQSETATQANLIALMGQVRENAKRMVVGLWLGALGRLILLTLVENMALPFWIKKAIDPTSPLAIEEAQDVARLWQQITAEELGDIDNDISVDLASMSPVQQAQERTDWLTFLGLVTNPTLGMVLSVSPALMRKTAGLFNIHSERDLAEVSKALMMMSMMQAQAAGAGTPGAPAPGPTPTNNDIAGQLSEQLPVEVAQG
jgi:hypothetical protein